MNQFSMTAMPETQILSLGRKDPLRRAWLLHGGSGEYPLQYSCLENPMDRGA